MNKVLYCLIVIILTGCNLTPSRLTCLNIRLWQDTPAWGLAKAVRNGDTVRIKKILAKGEVSVDYREPTYGQSLLHWAVLRNKAEMVEFLLKQGADINLRDYWSSASPILLACYHSDTDAEIVRILLNNGANPNDLATENDSVLEGNRRTPFTPLIVAASNSLEKVKLLIEAGADPYYCWKPGQNALKEAGTLRRFDIAEYLLIDCGMDPSRSFTITIVGDTLHFRDILDRNPNFRNTVENSASLKRIYQYLDEWEKKHKADSIFRHN
jgi:ankyrin repeat protein